MSIQSAQAAIPAPTYDHYTVKELKQLIKDRKVFGYTGTKKADLVKALEDEDKYKQSSDNLIKWATGITQDVKEIREVREKANNTIALAKSTLVKLKEKENKTTEDYEKIINLYEHLVALMSKTQFNL